MGGLGQCLASKCLPILQGFELPVIGPGASFSSLLRSLGPPLSPSAQNSISILLSMNLMNSKSTFA